MNQFHSAQNGKNGIFRTSGCSRIDFTQNLSDRKIMKFPHCVLPVRFYVKSILANSTIDCHYLKPKFFHQVIKFPKLATLGNFSVIGSKILRYENWSRSKMLAVICSINPKQLVNLQHFYPYLMWEYDSNSVNKNKIFQFKNNSIKSVKNNT